MAFDKKKLTQALIETREKAQAVANKSDDNGTCNFDTCMIVLKGMRQTTADKIAEDAGVQLDKWTCFGAGVFAVTGWRVGQGNSRSWAAEEATKTLKSHGFDAFTHYAMD